MRRIVLAAIPAALVFASSAFADPMATVEARQAYFKSLGASMKAMGPLTQSFDAEVAKVETAKLEAILATDISPLFAPGSSDADVPGKTRAKAKIWEDMENFGAKGKAMRAAGAELIAVAQGGDGDAFAAAYGKFGGACKACHDEYRLPE